MNPGTAALLQLPSATSWYMNPYFMASFGAIVALGFVIFAVAYFVFVKMKIAQPTAAPPGKEVRCDTCDITTDMIGKLIPCSTHAAVLVRLDGFEQWRTQHEEDYRELRRRIDALERRR